MKNLLLLLVGVSVALLPMNANAEIIDEVRHKNWTSFVLANNDNAYSRMTTQEVGSSENTTLVVDSFPKTCGAFLIQINVCGKELAGIEFSRTTTGAVRIDERSVFDVEYMVQADNSCMTLAVSSRSNPTIIKDMMAGNFVRFKIDHLDKTKNPFFKRYSLSGFTTAHRRVLALCQEIEEILNNMNDSGYFEEPQYPAPKPTKQNSDFFI